MLLSLGGGFTDLSAAVAVHKNRCGIVPSSTKQSWQDESSMAHLRTLHFRTWVHWPPLIADINDGANVFAQGVEQILVDAFPLAIGEMTQKKAKTTLSEKDGANTSALLWVMFGTSFKMR